MPASTIPLAVTSTAPLGALERIPSPCQDGSGAPRSGCKRRRQPRGGLGAPSWADTLRSISEEIWQLGEGSGDPRDTGAEIEANPGGVVQRGAPARCLPQKWGKEQSKTSQPLDLFVPADTPCVAAAGPAPALKAAPGELGEQLASWHGAGVVPMGLFLGENLQGRRYRCDPQGKAASSAPTAPAFALLPGAL